MTDTGGQRRPKHQFLQRLYDAGLWSPPESERRPVSREGPPLAPDSSQAARYVAAVLEGECRDVAATREGSRNDRLNRAAFRLGQYVGGGYLTAWEADDALCRAGEACGLPASEVARTVASGLTAGQDSPETIPVNPAVPPAYTLADAPSPPDDHEVEVEPEQGTTWHQRRVAEEVKTLRVRDEARRTFAAEQRGVVEPPESITLRERLSRPRLPKRWRIDGWQPVGARVLLAAQYKAGKTSLTGNLARCLVDGDLWLGRHQVETVEGVAILDFEMSTSQVEDWLRDQNIANDDKIVIIPMRGKAAAFDIINDEVRSEWAETLRGCGTKYLIVDCLRPILDALGLDEHRDAGRFLVALDALLSASNIADALVVHHMGHSGERSRGDSRIRDWPDVEWRMVRQNDEPASARYITAFGRDVDIPETQLAYDPATRRLTLAGGSRKDAAIRAALFDVLAILGGSEDPLSGRQVEEQMADSDHGQKAIRGALKLGARLGSIVTTPGPRRSTLHAKAPQCVSATSASPVRQHTACECVSASIDDALALTLDEDPVRQAKTTWKEAS